jgi:hypothetical protein
MKTNRRFCALKQAINLVWGATSGYVGHRRVNHEMAPERFSPPLSARSHAILSLP